MSTPNKPAARLLTVAEVAEYLALSEKTVYRTIKTGELAVMRRGRTLRITPSDLKAYVDAHRN